jgi:hypothetical protein
MIAVFTGLLKKDGLIILLSAREDILKNAAASPDLEIVQTLPVLVSGKKARVFKLKKVR